MSNFNNYILLSVPRTFELSTERPAPHCQSKTESAVCDPNIIVKEAFERAEKIKILRCTIPQIADMMGGGRSSPIYMRQCLQLGSSMECEKTTVVWHTTAQPGLCSVGKDMKYLRLYAREEIRAKCDARQYALSPPPLAQS